MTTDREKPDANSKRVVWLKSVSAGFALAILWAAIAAASGVRPLAQMVLYVLAFYFVARIALRGL